MKLLWSLLGIGLGYGLYSWLKGEWADPAISIGIQIGMIYGHFNLAEREKGAKPC